jgi:pimeloyl-ACP methyl ester carboxylesterase
MRYKEDIMQKSGYSRRGNGIITRVLGLSFLSALIYSIGVAIRHTLETPMRLKSFLPGEAHYYKWKRGYIFYKVLGEPEAPPLLLLHSPGLAASAYEMRKLIEPLAKHFHVYAPDLLGFGISDRPTMHYSADTYIELCRDFLTDVVEQPATIVASRISCNYAVATVANSPALCERLVLISPVALESEQWQASILPLRYIRLALEKVWHELLQVAPLKWLLYPMLSTRYALRFSLVKNHLLIDEIDLDYCYATTHQMGAEHASIALLAGKLEPDVSLQLKMIQQPTLVIWGDQGLNDSRHIGSQQAISWMKSHTRLALLPDAGLAVHEEQPASVIATILSWREEQKATIAPPANATTIEAYCTKCKMKRKILHATEVTAKDRRIAIRGTCGVCGSNLHRFVRLK